MDVVPVVRSQRPTILHSSPARPTLLLILRRAPDLLAPDDILEAERVAVLHYPFGDFLTGKSSILHRTHPVSQSKRKTEADLHRHCQRSSYP